MHPAVVAGALVASYLLGTFPSALIVTKSRGVDVTAEGSGNPGTSNVVRLLGWRYGAIVFALDLAKGALAATIGWQVDGDRLSLMSYACVAAAILGHTYPATRRFRGGKGVATGGGAMFVLHPIMSAVLFLSWFVLRKTTNKSSIASLAITIAVPVWIGVESRTVWEVLAALGLVFLVIIRHLPNLRRLQGGTELSA